MPFVPRRARRLKPCRAPLRLESLEARTVPANHLTVVDAVTASFHISSSTDPNGVTTFVTTGAGAELSLADIETAMRAPAVTGVVVSTAADDPANDAGEDGSIAWGFAASDDLDFTNFGPGKSMTFRTDATATAGDITLTGLSFRGSENDQTDLLFDTSNADGDVLFLSDGAAHSRSVTFGSVSLKGPLTATVVNTLTINAGAGAFVYENAKYCYLATLGSVSLTADTVVLNNVGGEARQFFEGGGISAEGGGTVIGLTAVSVGAGVTFDGTDFLNVTAPTVTVGEDAFLGASDLTLAGTTVNLTGPTIDGFDTLTITGGAVYLSAGPNAAAALETLGQITINGPVTLAGTVTVTSFSADQTITFSGSVDGTGDLVVSAARTMFQQDVGVTTPLTSLVIDGGLVDLGGHNLSAAQVEVGFEGAGTLAGTGTVTGTVTVNAESRLAPGGVGTIGTLKVAGTVTFDGGNLSIDLGAVSDRLVVTGNVVILDGSRLGDEQSSGMLVGAPAQVIDYTGALTGEFANAALGVPTLFGMDAIQVSTYGPANVGLVIELAPAAASGVVKGVDADGNGYTVKLTGGGTLVAGGAGEQFILVRDAEPTSRLTVTAKGKKGSDGAATFAGGVVVNGPLAAFVGAAADVGAFRVTGAAVSVTARDLGSVQLGGNATDATTITARNAGPITTGSTLTALKLRGVGGGVTAPAVGTTSGVDLIGDVTVTGGIESIKATGKFSGIVTAAHLDRFTARDTIGVMGLVIAGDVGPVSVARTFNGGVISTTGAIASVSMGDGTVTVRAPVGAIGSVTSRGNLGAELDAMSIGPVRVSGALQGFATWNVGTSIQSIAAAAILGLNVEADFVGSVRVKRNAARQLAGDIFNSNFLLSGNSGPTDGAFGLASLKAEGVIQNSTFTLLAGNAGPVTVGRFIGSDLYVGYTPGADFITGGTFAATPFMLTSFRATGRTGKDPADPLNWAFTASRVVADTIGKVDLKGLRTDNGGTPFGIQFRATCGPVSVRSADAPIPAVVTPSPTAIVTDFFLIIAG